MALLLKYHFSHKARGCCDECDQFYSSLTLILVIFELLMEQQWDVTVLRLNQGDGDRKRGQREKYSIQQYLYCTDMCIV